MDKRAIVIDPADTVAVVAQPVDAGDEILIVEHKTNLVVKDGMKTGHKVALVPIKSGEMVIKYGIPIGRASGDIAPGEWVHCHNLDDITEELCDKYTREYRAGGVAV